MKKLLIILTVVFCFTSAVYAEEAAAPVGDKIVAVGDFAVDLLKTLKPKKEVVNVQTEDINTKNSLYTANAIVKDAAAFVVVDKAIADKKFLKPLEKAGIEPLIVTEAINMDGLQKEIIAAGDYLNEKNKATETKKKLQSVYKNLQLKLNTVPSEVDMLYISSIDKNGVPSAAGYNTAASAAMFLVGGYNVIENTAHEVKLTPEVTKGLNPKHVLVDKNVLADVGGEDGLIALPQLAPMGLASGQIIAVDGKRLENFTPDTLKLVITLATDLFPAVDFSDVAVK